MIAYIIIMSNVFLIFFYDCRKEPKQWDRFTQSSNDNISSDDVQFWDKVFVITKIVVTFLLFFLTLGTAVVAKICFAIIAANIFPTNDGTLQDKLKTANGTLSYGIDKTNVQWIWAMTMLTGAPYFFATLKLVWRLLFQITTKTGPDWATLLVVRS